MCLSFAPIKDVPEPAFCCSLLQILVNYVAMNPQGRVFENSLEKGPFDIRYGSGRVLCFGTRRLRPFKAAAVEMGH